MPKGTLGIIIGSYDNSASELIYFVNKSQWSRFTHTK